MNLFQKFFLQQPDLAARKQPALNLLFDRRPDTTAAVLEARLGELSALEPLRTTPRLEVEADWQSSSLLLAVLTFDDHRIEIAGFSAPMPAASIERCILASSWSADFKELLQSHLLYVVLCYEGTHTDPIEQHIALYKAARLFAGDELLGVANEPAWTCHPAPLIGQITEPAMLPVCRQSPPLVYWTGFVKGLFGEEYWALTKGYHLFGVADLATVVLNQEDLQRWHEVFQEVFHYLYFEKADVQAGDALQIDEQTFLLFEAIPDSHDALRAVSETLAVREASADEVEFWQLGQN
jgi:hypothetical protein